MMFAGLWRLALCVLAWPAAAAMPGGSGLVQIEPDMKRIATWQALRIVNPEATDLAPSQAANLLASEAATTVDSPDRVVGRGVRPWWASVSLRSAAREEQSRLVALETTTQHDVRLYRRTADGTWHRLPEVADQAGRRFAGGTVHPLWALNFAAGERVDLLLRIEGPAVVRFPLFVLHPSIYAEWSLKFHVAIGIAFGVCLFVAVYVVYWRRYLEDDTVFLFVAMLVADLAGALWLSGFLSALLPAVSEKILSLAGLAAYAVLYGCGCLHARNYLQVRDWSPITDRVLLVAGWLWLALASWLPAVFPVMARVLMVWGGSAVALLLVVTSVNAARRKVSFSEYIAAAWLSYLAIGLSFTVARATEDPRFWSSSAFALLQPTLVATLFWIAMNQRLIANRDQLLKGHRETTLQHRHQVELMRQRSLLFAATNHDLRQPLIGVGLYANLLKSAIDPGDRAAIAGKLDQALREIDDLLIGIQQLAAIHEASHRPPAEPVQLDSLLAPVIDEYRGRAAAKGIVIRYVPTRLTVTSHAPFLLRIVRNVLSNTLRYTERGGRVLVGMRRGGGPRLLIADTGCGMTAEQTSRAFEPFERFDDPVAIPQGIGLGLFSVRSLADTLGLTIRLRGQPGRGTCFEMTLRATTVSPQKG